MQKIRSSIIFLSRSARCKFSYHGQFRDYLAGYSLKHMRNAIIDLFHVLDTIHRLLTESNGTHFVSAIYRPLICLHPAFPVNPSPYNIFFLPYFHSLSICFDFISKYKTREKVKSAVPTL